MDDMKRHGGTHTTPHGIRNRDEGTSLVSSTSVFMTTYAVGLSRSTSHTSTSSSDSVQQQTLSSAAEAEAKLNSPNFQQTSHQNQPSPSVAIAGFTSREVCASHSLETGEPPSAHAIPSKPMTRVSLGSSNKRISLSHMPQNTLAAIFGFCLFPTALRLREVNRLFNEIFLTEIAGSLAVTGTARERWPSESFCAHSGRNGELADSKSICMEAHFEELHSSSGLQPTTPRATLWDIFRYRQEVLDLRQQEWARWLYRCVQWRISYTQDALEEHVSLRTENNTFSTLQTTSTPDQSKCRSEAVKEVEERLYRDGLARKVKLCWAMDSFRRASEEWLGHLADIRRVKQNIRHCLFNRVKLYAHDIQSGVQPVFLPDSSLCVVKDLVSVIIYSRRPSVLLPCFSMADETINGPSRSQQARDTLWAEETVLHFNDVISGMFYNVHQGTLLVSTYAGRTFVYRIITAKMIALEARLTCGVEQLPGPPVLHSYFSRGGSSTSAVPPKHTTEVHNVGAFRPGGDAFGAFVMSRMDSVPLPPYVWTTNRMVEAANSLGRVLLTRWSPHFSCNPKSFPTADCREAMYGNNIGIIEANMHFDGGVTGNERPECAYEVVLMRGNLDVTQKVLPAQHTSNLTTTDVEHMERLRHRLNAFCIKHQSSFGAANFPWTDSNSNYHSGDNSGSANSAYDHNFQELSQLGGSEEESFGDESASTSSSEARVAIEGLEAASPSSTDSRVLPLPDSGSFSPPPAPMSSGEVEKVFERLVFGELHEEATLMIGVAKTREVTLFTLTSVCMMHLGAYIGEGTVDVRFLSAPDFERHQLSKQTEEKNDFMRLGKTPASTVPTVEHGETMFACLSQMSIVLCRHTLRRQVVTHEKVVWDAKGKDGDPSDKWVRDGDGSIPTRCVTRYRTRYIVRGYWYDLRNSDIVPAVKVPFGGQFAAPRAFTSLHARLPLLDAHTRRGVPEDGNGDGATTPSSFQRRRPFDTSDSGSVTPLDRCKSFSNGTPADPLSQHKKQPDDLSRLPPCHSPMEDGHPYFNCPFFLFLQSRNLCISFQRTYTPAEMMVLDNDQRPYFDSFPIFQTTVTSLDDLLMERKRTARAAVRHPLAWLLENVSVFSINPKHAFFVVATATGQLILVAPQLPGGNTFKGNSDVCPTGQANLDLGSSTATESMSNANLTRNSDGTLSELQVMPFTECVPMREESYVGSPRSSASRTASLHLDSPLQQTTHSGDLGPTEECVVPQDMEQTNEHDQADSEHRELQRLLPIVMVSRRAFTAEEVFGSRFHLDKGLDRIQGTYPNLLLDSKFTRGLSPLCRGKPNNIDPRSLRLPLYGCCIKKEDPGALRRPINSMSMDDWKLTTLSLSLEVTIYDISHLTRGPDTSCDGYKPSPFVVPLLSLGAFTCAYSQLNYLTGKDRILYNLLVSMPKEEPTLPTGESFTWQDGVLVLHRVPLENACVVIDFFPTYRFPRTATQSLGLQALDCIDGGLTSVDRNCTSIPDSVSYPGFQQHINQLKRRLENGAFPNFPPCAGSTRDVNPLNAPPHNTSDAAITTVTVNIANGNDYMLQQGSLAADVVHYRESGDSSLQPTAQVSLLNTGGVTVRDPAPTDEDSYASLRETDRNDQLQGQLASGAKGPNSNALLAAFTCCCDDEIYICQDGAPHFPVFVQQYWLYFRLTVLKPLLIVVGIVCCFLAGAKLDDRISLPMSAIFGMWSPVALLLAYLEILGRRQHFHRDRALYVVMCVVGTVLNTLVFPLLFALKHDLGTARPGNSGRFHGTWVHVVSPLVVSCIMTVIRCYLVTSSSRRSLLLGFSFGTLVSIVAALFAIPTLILVACYFDRPKDPILHPDKPRFPLVVAGIPIMILYFSMVLMLSVSLCKGVCSVLHLITVMFAILLIFPILMFWMEYINYWRWVYAPQSTTRPGALRVLGSTTVFPLCWFLVSLCHSLRLRHRPIVSMGIFY